MTQERNLSWEMTLYALALGLALALRLLLLGAQPLSEQEAQWAMNALNLARPPAEALALSFAPNPAYLLLTGFTFRLFGATDFAARLWPALAGASLALLPWLFRKRLGRPAALVMAFGLAFDPLLVTFSRSAGGPMLAIAFTFFAIGLWDQKQPVWAGVLAGLALLSGTTVWFGLLAFGLAWLVRRVFRRKQADEQPVYLSGEARRFSLVAALLTLVFAGTAFLNRPGLLAAGVGGVTSFVSNWLSPALVSPGQMLAAFFTYQPLAFIFGLAALGSWLEARLGWREEEEFDEAGEAYPPRPCTEPRLPDVPWLLLLFGVALLLALLYPARLPSDLAWALTPLWAAAAMSIGRCLPEERPHIMSFLQAGLVFILAALLWVWLSSTETLLPPEAAGAWIFLRPAIVLGILALGVLITALFALGWSWPIARDGLVWGLIAAYVVYGMAGLSSASFLNPGQPQELLSLPPGPGQARLFEKTLHEVSNRAVGINNLAEVVSLVDTASMRWELRNFPKARFVGGIDGGQEPAIVITYRVDDAPDLLQTHRGQDFVWWTRPGWEGVLPPNPVAWWAYRAAPVSKEKIILWVRSDLFIKE